MNKTKYMNSLIIIRIVFISFLLLPFCNQNELNIFSNITNTHHDFTGASWTNSETCRLCHTPHNAIANVTPLWNHQLSSAAYTVYSSSTLDASMGQPSGESKLCLSCHDGTVALDNIGGHTSGSFMIVARYNLGTNLSSHHPISFAYNSALATAYGQMADPSTAPSGLGGTIDQDFLQDGKMQCSSCHDVHVDRKTDNTCNGCHFVNGFTTQSLSIRVSNDNSALCLTCHKK